MRPLDLSIAPPRAPRETLAGVVFLPRTIDKVRATLPGGAIGAYTIPGFSAMMLKTLGIDVDAFTDAVAAKRRSKRRIRGFSMAPRAP